MEDIEDTTYLVGNKREITIPENSTSARSSILNSLRTILPAVCKLKLDDIVHLPTEYEGLEINFLIYDWFYKHSELRMLVLNLTNFCLYDAFTIRDDILHVLKSKKIIESSDVHTSSFDGYLIRNNQLQWNSLNKSLCCSIKSCKFNSSLSLWFVEPILLQNCFVKNPPSSWKPFDHSFVHLLHFSPQLAFLQHNNKCSDSNCICMITDISIYDLLHKIPSCANEKLLQWIDPSIKSIQYYYKNFDTSISITPQIKKIKKPRFSFNLRGERCKCLLSLKCIEAATCYWVTCCEPNEPVACKQHAKDLFESDVTNVESGICICPKHKISSRVAFLLI